MAESGLIVRVPQAEALVDDLRLLHTEAAQLGVPAHITVLFPFMAPECIDSAIVARIGEALSAHRTFEFSLAAVGRFPATTFLAPDPAAPFVALTDALAREFPQYPPFGGEFAQVIPHLTVAHGDEGVAAMVERDLTARLAARGPVRSRCEAVELYENATGRWRPMRRFELAR